MIFNEQHQYSVKIRIVNFDLVVNWNKFQALNHKAVVFKINMQCVELNQRSPV